MIATMLGPRNHLMNRSIGLEVNTLILRTDRTTFLEKDRILGRTASRTRNGVEFPKWRTPHRIRTPRGLLAGSVLPEAELERTAHCSAATTPVRPPQGINTRRVRSELCLRVAAAFHKPAGILVGTGADGNGRDGCTYWREVCEPRAVCLL